MPYLSPESLPSEVCTITLVIPNDELLRLAVMGQVYELSRSRLWEQYGAITPDEAADAMASVYNNAFYCEPPPMTQVAFEVRKTASQSPTVNTIALVTFPSPVTNIGGSWDSGSNAFVAPVKGVYSFQTSVSGPSLNLLRINVDGTNKAEIEITGAGFGVLPITMQVDAGQAVTVSARVTGGNISGTSQRTYFSGHLVYELP